MGSFSKNCCFPSKITFKLENILLPMSMHHEYKTKLEIVFLKKSGLTYKEISRKTSIPIRSVKKIITKFKKTADVLRKSGSGRPRVFTAEKSEALSKILKDKKIIQSKRLEIR